MNLNNLLLLDYLNVIKRRRWLILGIFLGVVLTVTVFTLRRPKLYRAATVVEIGAETPDVAFFKEVVSVNPTNWWNVARYYETQNEIIRSNSLHSKVSKRLIEKNVWPALRGQPDETAYVGRVSSGLKVEPRGQSALVNVVFIDTDQNHIAEVANTIAEVYIEENLNKKLVGAKQAVDWLSDQMRRFAEQKNASEIELQEYREKYKIVSTENPHAIMEVNLKGLSETLNDLAKDRIKLEARYNQMESLVKSTRATDDLFGLIDSDVLKKLKTDYIDQERKFLVLSVRYKSMHPEIIRAKKELEELKKKIALEVTNELQRLKSRYLLTKAEEDRIRQELDNKKLEALEFDKISYQLQNITRIADTNQKFFLALNEKLKEADLSGLVKSNNIRIIDPAQTPTAPFSPKIALNILLAMMIGLIGGLGCALMWEYMDATFKTPTEVQAIFSVPFLGFIPMVEQSASPGNGDSPPDREPQPENIAHIPTHSPNSAVAEMYRNIRTNLSFATSARMEKTLLITSTSPEEGKTTTSLNLSITLAQLGQKILVVDADMRRPSIHKMFDLSDKKGFSSLLINSISIEEAIQKTNIDNLDVITAGPIPPNPSELLSAPALEHVLNSLKGQYDKIIIDACPIIPISDTLVLSQKVDGIIFVIRAEGPHRNMVIKAKNQLEALKVNMIGCILNGVNPDRMATTDRYYYRYGYHRYRLEGAPPDPAEPTPNA